MLTWEISADKKYLQYLPLRIHCRQSKRPTPYVKTDYAEITYFIKGAPDANANSG